MKKLLALLLLLGVISCSKEQEFNCLDIYEVTLSKNKEYVAFKLRNDNKKYKANINYQTDNQIVYSKKLGRKDRSFRYIPKTNSLSIITSAGEGECTLNS